MARLEPTQRQQPMLFVNGIENTQPNAAVTAQSLSTYLGGRHVEVFYNPTDLNSYMDSRPERVRQQKKLVRELANKIRTLASQGDTSLTIFSHSHGTVITQDALKELDQNLRTRITVIAFGGATVIPNDLADRVINLFTTDDLIAQMGNVRSKTHQLLSCAKKVHETMQFKGWDQEMTINNCAYDDLRMRLEPTLRVHRNESRETMLLNNARHQAFFVNENLDALWKDAEFLRMRQEYLKMLEEYTFAFIPSSPAQKIEFTPLARHSSFEGFLRNIPENLWTGLVNTGKAIAGTASHALANHECDIYLPYAADQVLLEQ